MGNHPYFQMDKPIEILARKVSQLDAEVRALVPKGSEQMRGLIKLQESFFWFRQALEIEQMKIEQAKQLGIPGVLTPHT